MNKSIGKVINSIISIIEWLICALLLILICLTAFQKFSNQGSFFGYRIYTVASGSMVPDYDVGDTLLIKETDTSLIKKGDVVTYKGETAGVDGLIVTHLVVDVEVTEEGSRLFHTKGIANKIEDPIVSENQILGKVIYRFYSLSILGRITTSKALLLIFIIVPIAFLIAVEIIKMVFDKDEEKLEYKE